MVRTPPPKASNSAAKQLVSPESATAMALAAVIAALAAAVLVPFLMSLGCWPVKGASRIFLIEWPVLLPGMMAMTSVATVVALQLM